MSKSASGELRSRWLEAVLLPGESDPRASCLKELAEYTGRSEAEVQRLCEGAIDAQRELWDERERADDDSLVQFYNDCDAYIYELLWWHALEQGDAPIWNARLVDIAQRFGTRRYLDFGAGIGSNGILLGRPGVLRGGDIEVTLADISDVMQRFARWRLERRDIAARFIDLKAASLAAECYDLISAVDVLEHVSDPLATLAELHRALAPGGILVFDLIASKPDPERPFHLLRSKYPIRSRIRGLGFAFVESFQKYLVYQKVTRGALGDRFVSGWDRLRWRTYYLLQGQWPRARTDLAETK